MERSVLGAELVAVLAGWASWHTKLKVAGLSPAEVHLLSYPKKCCFNQTNQARLGLVALDLNNLYVQFAVAV